MASTDIRLRIRILLTAVLIAFISLTSIQFHSVATFRDPVPGSCTIFSAAIGDRVLFGNNEDYYKPKTYLWTEPGTDSTYGCIYLGYKTYSHQGGINEKGLCFDANALPGSQLIPHDNLPLPPTYPPPYQDYAVWIPVLILRKAATVKEAVKMATKYQRSNWYPQSGDLKYQLYFADATGDAVVMSVDQNGELAFSRKEQGKSYLISTNFNKANSENALEYPCERYQKADEMLSRINSENDLTHDFFKSILDSVHVSGLFNTTLYSNVFDLKKGMIYLYHWHQYNEVVVLDVNKELAKKRYLIRIKDLFSPATVRNASNEYKGIILRWSLASILGTVILVLVLHYLRKIRSL